MKTLFLALAWLVGIALAVGISLLIWLNTLAEDDGGAGRPTYGQPYAWTKAEISPGVAAPNATPEGGPKPRPDGYVMGSLGHDYILPPMPPERTTDIARKDNVFRNFAIKNCFWPGPRLRSGYYTTDPDGYGIENQMPDIGNTFSTAWFKIPAGAKIVMRGNFPHMRHWSFTTYSENGVPRDVINDIDIDPEAGSFNPFRPGVRRDAEPRHYTVTIANGEPPAQRPSNTVYTRTKPDVAIGMHMRNYVPDHSVDWTGGVGVPGVEVYLADGRVLKDAEACAATDAPLRGKQVPITVPKKLWMALNSLPWRPADRTPANNFEVATMQKFYNREHLLLRTFFPSIPSDFMAVEKGGFWSNLNTRYGFTYLSQAYGKVYVVHGKMPSTPHTWNGDPTPLDHGADMRYWSICTTTAPAVGNSVDCLTDENVQSTLDKDGNFNVVVSRAIDRPSNATEKCGVQWMEYGDGDGIPGGSQNYGALINRHTAVNPKFKHSWFDVTRVHEEESVLGPYLPKVINLHEKARFETLGCPVDTTKLVAMAQQRK